ncbi:hypothetical protein [Corallococcus macrosporus]|nr:hypothetical protein [Corallococcus macrosporus]AEI66327.1 hypothetical protein LILAB_22150 [Corallococcus macrosporus]
MNESETSTITDAPAHHNRLVRVAVVQLDYHPAFKDVLYEPLPNAAQGSTSLLPEGMVAAPGSVQTRYRELRHRIRQAYIDQLRRRITAILHACKTWQVQVVVFPEYSIPPEILAPIAREAGEILIVAGSHYVDRVALREKVYEKLGKPEQSKLIEQSVSPVIHKNRLLALVPKLHAAKPEVGTLRLGNEWEPVSLPSEFPGPMGVLICLDFISRQSTQHLKQVAQPLGNCRFLAAPALTPTHSLPEFDAQAVKEARREHRPVLFANIATHGGSTVFVDEGRPTDHSRFPEHVGRLEPSEEGVIVADIDLGHVPVGTSTPHILTPPIIPFAAASLVYRGAEQSYARWLEEFHAKLATPGNDDFERLEDCDKFVRQNPPPIPPKTSARKRRLEQLVQDVADESSLNRIKQLSTELLLPDDILPLEALSAALAAGASDELRSWINEPGASEFGPVAARLIKPWEKLQKHLNTWSVKSQNAAAEVRSIVRGGPAPQDPKVLVGLIDAYETEIERGFETESQKANEHAAEGRYEEARTIYQLMLQRAEDMLPKGEPAARPKLQRWVARCRLFIALATLNLQEHKEARERLLAIEPQELSIGARLRLAEALALTGERARAMDIIPSEDQISLAERQAFVEVQQTMALLDGLVPKELVNDPTLHLRAANIFLEKHDLAAAVRHALRALEKDNSLPLMRAMASFVITEALWRTIYEDPIHANLIPVEHRTAAIQTLETLLKDLHKAPLPTAIKNSVNKLEGRFKALIAAPDMAAEHHYPSTDTKEGPGLAETPYERAFYLARTGNIEEALQTLPTATDDHPWHTRLDRAELRAVGGQNGQALDEALALAQEFPNRAPIAFLAADMLARQGRFAEALPLAEEAFKQLPGLGYRLLLARQRLQTHDAKGAWELLRGSGGDSPPSVLHTLALAADQTGRLSDAEKAWRHYLELRPGDAISRIVFAQLLFRLHQPIEAAAVAWRVFQENNEHLEPDALHTCGTLQRLAGPLDEEQTRRVKAVAARLKERFPMDVRAEFLRLQLLATLKDLPEDVDPIDFSSLAEAGYVHKREGLPALLDYSNQRRKLLQNVERLRRCGAIPTATACSLGGTKLAHFVTRILERSRQVSGLLCPPVAASRALASFRLEGATILTSDLELILLEVLDLVPVLRTALGTAGRLVLFESARDRILEDAARLRIDARPDRLRKIEALLRRLEQHPQLAPDPDHPTDDAAAARRVGAALVDFKEHPDIIRISPHTFVQHLHEQRIVDEQQRHRIEQHLSSDSAPPPTMPIPLPECIGISWPVVEALFSAETVDAVFDTYGEQLRLGPSVIPYFRSERDELASVIRAYELADQLHARLTEAWIHVEAGVSPPPPPALRAANPEWDEELVLKPLQEVLPYQHALKEHPDWLRLTADFYGSETLGPPEFFHLLAWKSVHEALALNRDLRSTSKQHIPLPTLVRILISPEQRESVQYLPRLAELGFPNALGATEILRLERRYKGLDTGEPRRLLDQQEWMAREPNHLGGDLARLQLAGTYAQAIFDSFLTEERSEAAKNAILDTLMQRQERIGKEATTNSLEQIFALLAAHTMDRWRLAFRQEGKIGTLNPESPIVSIWRALSKWAGRSGLRRAAHGRALREAWITFAHRHDGPPLHLSLVLSQAHRHVPRPGSTSEEIAAAFSEPELESLTILSANWKESPLTTDELLKNGAAFLASAPESIHGARWIMYPVRIGASPNSVSVKLPIEALFLRMSGRDRQRLAPYFKYAQGPLDGISYEYIDAIENAPDDVKLLSRYAAHAATSLFRLVQDDPSFLKTWSNSYSFRYCDDRSKFEELCAVLSEPAELLPTGMSLAGLLRERVESEAGCWRHREDAERLIALACELPGTLPSLLIANRLDDDQYADHVHAALERLANSNEHPIGRIATDILFLRMAAEHRPSITNSKGSLELRQILPTRFLQLVEAVSVSPPADTMAAAEAGLLRLCAEVIQRVSFPRRLPIRDGLWLTYRLFQWLCLQLESLTPQERHDGITGLLEQAPRAGPPPLDVLDPFNFGPERFDHRLAAVLHALTTMEMLIPHSPPPEPAKHEPCDVSSKDLEEKLLTLAQNVSNSPNPGSKLEWHAPGNVPDLALRALFHLKPMRVADLSPEARMRRFKEIPQDPDALAKSDPAAAEFASHVVTSAAVIAGCLTTDERRLLETKLHALVDGPTSRYWKWMLFVRLFSEGEAHLKEEAQRLTAEHMGNALAPFLFGLLLLGITESAPAQLAGAVDEVLAALRAKGEDPLPPIGATIEQLLAYSTPGAQEVARTLALKLTEQSGLGSDPRIEGILSRVSLSNYKP